MSEYQKGKQQAKPSPKERDRQEALTELRKILKPGDTVHTILRHVSRSGMMRVIDVMVIRNGNTQNIAWFASRALDQPLHKRYDGLTVGGCGMDMGFHLVYTLSHYLYPDGFKCIGKRKCCPANDHANGDRNYRPHMHKDGGYALLQRWV